MAFAGIPDVGKDALDIAEVGPPPQVEVDTTSSAFEQGVAKVFLEHADAVGNGGGSDPEFLGGAGEALVPCRGVEEAETVERREVRHGGLLTLRRPLGTHTQHSREAPSSSRNFGATMLAKGKQSRAP